jgi:thiamine transport system ATP-binding protein
MVTHDHDEAFAVADRLAVMRAGRVVQQGDIEAVWRAPVDAETALFLGYARVLEGAAADRVLAAIDSARRSAPESGVWASRTSRTIEEGIGVGALAVRRSALRLDDDGALAGTVVSARSTPEQVRLVVAVAGVGEVDAVAPLDRHPGPGEAVRLGVDATRVARIPRGSTAEGSIH